MDTRNQRSSLSPSGHFNITIAIDNLRDRINKLIDDNQQATEQIENQIVADYEKLIERINLQNQNQVIYQKMANLAHSYAIYFFNRNKNKRAASYYLQAIRWLEKIKCEPAELRKIVGHAIDLSESYMLLAWKDLAIKSIQFAIQIFNLIPDHEKTVKEKLLNPTKDFVTFFTHYQTISSMEAYLQSTRFKNIQNLIHSFLQESELESLLSNLEILDGNEDLSSVFNNISLEHQEAINSSSHPTLNIEMNTDTPDEGQIRTVIHELRLILSKQERSKNTNEAAITKNQILKFYELLPNKTDADLTIIKTLQLDSETQQQTSYGRFFSQPETSTTSYTASSSMDLT